jgi:CBS domain-containing protein
MKLSEIMTTKVVSVEPSDSLDVALRLLDKHEFRHLPVVHMGALVSILSRRDLSLATGWLTSLERKARGDRGPLLVREIMRDRVVTLTPDHELEAAASMMVGKRLGMIPILSNSLLAGVVTTSDVLGAIRRRNPRAEWVEIGESHAKVSEYMQPEPDTLPPGRGVAEAAGICRRKALRHLAITEKGEIVGLVSERELRFELEEREPIGTRPLSDIMVTDVVTIGPDEDLSAAADSMIRNRVSVLPVVADRELLGLLTDEDVMQHYTARCRPPAR